MSVIDCGLIMVKAVTLITTELAKWMKYVRKIREIKGVKDAFAVAGRADIVVYFEEDIKKVALEVHKIEGVRRTGTLIQVE